MIWLALISHLKDIELDAHYSASSSISKGYQIKYQFIYLSNTCLDTNEDDIGSKVAAAILSHPVIPFLPSHHPLALAALPGYMSSTVPWFTRDYLRNVMVFTLQHLVKWSGLKWSGFLIHWNTTPLATAAQLAARSGIGDFLREQESAISANRSLLLLLLLL